MNKGCEEVEVLSPKGQEGEGETPQGESEKAGGVSHTTDITRSSRTFEHLGQGNIRANFL